MNRPPRRPQDAVGRRQNVPPQATQKRQTQPQAKVSREEMERRRRAAQAQEAKRREAEAKRAARLEQIKKEKKKRRAFLAKLFLYRAIVYLVFLALILSVTAVVFFASLNKVDKIDDSDFTYILADEKKVSLPYYKVMRNGVMYINFSEMSEKFGMAVTGSLESMRFISDYEDEFVRFTPGSNKAEVNGHLIYLSGDAVLDGNDLWIPLDLITDYMDGISVKYDQEARTLTVKQIAYGAENRPLTFSLKDSSAIPNIEESEEYGTVEPKADTK